MALTPKQEKDKNNLLTTSIGSGVCAAAAFLLFGSSPAGLLVAGVLGLVSLLSGAAAAMTGSSTRVAVVSTTHKRGPHVGVAVHSRHHAPAPGHRVLHEVHHGRPHHSHVHVSGSKPANPVTPGFKAKKAASGVGFSAATSGVAHGGAARPTAASRSVLRKQPR